MTNPDDQQPNSPHEPGAPAPQNWAGPQFSSADQQAAQGYQQGYQHTQQLPQGEWWQQPEPSMQYAAAPPPPATTTRREKRRPGWGALIVAMLGASLLASGATAATMSLASEQSAPATSSSAPDSSGQGLPSVQAPVPADGTLDWNKVASAVSPSVVAIRVSGSNASGAGSGVLLDKQGHIVTNNHVASGGGANEQIQVVLSDGRVYSDIKVVGLDPDTDLAVLQIENPPSDLKPAALGDSSKVVVGQPVMAVGNPLGLADTVTTGIISAVDRPVTTQAEQDSQSQNPFGTQQQTQANAVITNALQTDAAINPGNSGGALVDASGAVVGIPSSIASMGSSSSSGQAGSIGLGFAIPVNEARRIANELISTGKATHAWLGVQLNDGTATVDGTTRQGAKLANIVGDTPAAKAGLKAGDVVTSIDGEMVSGAESLTAQIRERAPGDKVTMKIVRSGAEQEITATLGTKQN